MACRGALETPAAEREAAPPPSILHEITRAPKSGQLLLQGRDTARITLQFQRDNSQQGSSLRWAFAWRLTKRPEKSYHLFTVMVRAFDERENILMAVVGV